MKKLPVLTSIIATLLLFTAPTRAAEFRGTVSGFYINKNGEALVRIKGTVPNQAINCTAGNGWDLTFSSATEVGKIWVSMLMATRLSNSEIRVGYVPNSAGICTVDYFYYYDR